jgi:hypothetical protein
VWAWIAPCTARSCHEQPARATPHTLSSDNGARGHRPVTCSSFGRRRAPQDCVLYAATQCLPMPPPGLHARALSLENKARRCTELAPVARCRQAERATKTPLHEKTRLSPAYKAPDISRGARSTASCRGAAHSTPSRPAALPQEIPRGGAMPRLRAPPRPPNHEPTPQPSTEHPTHTDTAPPPLRTPPRCTSPPTHVRTRDGKKELPARTITLDTYGDKQGRRGVRDGKAERHGATEHHELHRRRAQRARHARGALFGGGGRASRHQL